MDKYALQRRTTWVTIVCVVLVGLLVLLPAFWPRQSSYSQHLVLLFSLSLAACLWVYIILRPEFGLLLLVASVFVPSSFWVAGACVYPADILVIALSIGLLLRMLVRQRIALPRTSLDYFITLFLLVGLTSLMYAGDQWTAAKEILQWIISFVLLYYAILLSIRDEETFKRVIDVLLLGLLVTSFGTIYRFGAEMIMRGGIQYYRAGGGHLAALGGAMTFGLLLYTPSRRTRIRVFALLGAFLVSLLLSLTRGAWLAFIVAVLSIALLRSVRAFLLSIVVLLAAAMLLLFPQPDLRALIFFRGSRVFDPNQWSNVKRLFLARAAIAMVTDHPWGVGLDNFGRQFVNNYAPPQLETLVQRGTQELALNIRAHSQYLTMLAEIGIQGLIAFLGILGLVLGQAIRWGRGSQRHRVIEPYRGALLAGWLFFLSLFLWADLTGNLRLLFALLAALIMKLPRIESAPRTDA